MTKNVDTLVTTSNFILTFSSRALYSRLSIQYSHTELQVTLILKRSVHLATGLLHYSTSHACLQSTFDGYGTSLQLQQHQLMSLNRLCVLFLFPIQFSYICVKNTYRGVVMLEKTKQKNSANTYAFCF